MKHTTRCLLLGIALTASLSSFAQYSWIDNMGRRVFSDQPPPASISKKNIIAMPLAPTAPASSILLPASAASAPKTASSASTQKAASAANDQDKVQKRQNDTIDFGDNAAVKNGG